MIAKNFTNLVKILNSILICLRNGGQECLLETLGGLFIDQMHLVIDITRPFCDSKGSDVTLIESTRELPKAYLGLDERLARVITRSRFDLNSDILEDIEFKFIIEPNLTINHQFMQTKIGKWKKADMIIQGKILKISTDRKSLFKFKVRH